MFPVKGSYSTHERQDELSDGMALPPMLPAFGSPQNGQQIVSITCPPILRACPPLANAAGGRFLAGRKKDGETRGLRSSVRVASLSCGTVSKHRDNACGFL